MDIYLEFSRRINLDLDITVEVMTRLCRRKEEVFVNIIKDGNVIKYH